MERILVMYQDSSAAYNGVADEPEEQIHYAGVDEFTLCGIAPEEDVRYPDVFFNQTKKRVTCEKCLSIRDHVLGR